MLDVVRREYADHHEAAMLERQERAAETWFWLCDNGNGTWSGRFVIPDLQAQLLQTVLQHRSSPRRLSRNAAGESVVDPTVSGATGGYAGLGWTESMGQAFLELCEHLPTDGLAQHGRVRVTIAVHLDQHLLDGLAAAHRLWGSARWFPQRGNAVDTGSDLSAGEAGRLACGAGIIPAVYGGASVPLDLGRASRGCSPRLSASPCRRSTTPAQPRGAGARSRGPRSTTPTRGRAAAAPTCATRCRSAGGTTDMRTTVATN
jgi:hypothetical protein